MNRPSGDDRFTSRSAIFGVVRRILFELHMSIYTFRPPIAVRGIGMSLKVKFMKLQQNNVLQTVNMYYIL